MFSRRGFVTAAGIASAGVVSAATGGLRAQTPAKSADSAQCRVMTREIRDALTPADAMRRLQEGNDRFVSHKSFNCDVLDEAIEVSEFQYPYVAVLSCIDSRVPIESIFDEALGSIISVKVAGNIINSDIVGSLEYAVKYLGVKAIVVLGHTNCGAVKSAIDQVASGTPNESESIATLLKAIEPAVTGANVGGEKTSKNKQMVQAVADANAFISARKIEISSPLIRGMSDRYQIIISSGMYDIETGKATILG